MSQNILTANDFVVGSAVHNVQGVLYRGEGSPLGQKTASNLGSIWIDITSGNLWIATSISSNTGWQPFYGQLTSNITIASDVQEGDLVGIYGAGTWANSGALNVSKASTAGTGSQSSGVAGGGQNSAGNALTSAELFNGSTWTLTGNLNQSRILTSLFGAQNAGAIVAGQLGATNAGTSTELFNGATWTVSGTLSQSRTNPPSVGTQNSGIVVGGILGGTTYGSTFELFNGATWTLSANLLNQIRAQSGLAGGQAAAVVAGGATTGAGAISSVELFNGSTWIFGSVLSTTKQGMGSGGAQSAAIVSGGSLGGGGSITTTELYNGTTWGASGSQSQTRFYPSGFGSQLAMAVAGGNTGTCLNTTELHTQSTYRRLNYSSMSSTNNIGMAYNVNVTNFTATLCQGDVPNTRLASQNFFGFNKYTQEASNIVLENTRNITSITASSNTAIITTSSNTAVCNGMLLLIAGATNPANNGLFPVTSFSGGTQITVKNPSAVTQASATGTIQLVYANRLSGLVTSSISVSGNVATITFTSAGGLSATQFQRLVRVGGNIYIPYASTSGAAGSQYNWGTYRVTGVGSLTVTATTLNAGAVTENIAATTVEYWGQGFTESVIPQGSYVIGFNNRIGLIQRAMTDATMNY